ncbi:6-hydroxymethylpterin diphosphokinase MptE-like protein [Priestia megaterium]|uniref:motility associated factor glycosyltransferase family protein n=1 Tax=Priestia megaterium TaxID=1404 RepID=UPI0030088A84
MKNNVEFTCLQSSNDGYPIVKAEVNENAYYMHSKYNPVKEADNWAKNIVISSRISRIVVVGLAAGYHIFALKRHNPTIVIDVVELNEKYLGWSREHKVLKKHLHSLKVMSLKEFSLINFTEGTNVQIVIYPPSLKIITNEKLLEKVQQLQLVQQTVQDQAHVLDDNFQMNIKLNDSSVNTGLNINVEDICIIVSAGPSLTKQLPILKSIEKKAKIFSVGTALKPLLNAGIKPDYVMVTDPKLNVVEQLKVNLTSGSIPLLYLSTANHEAVSIWPFERYIVWQKGYAASEKAAQLHNSFLVKTGGSVATTLTDLLVKTGACNLVYVGQDLAFTNGLSHALHTHNQNKVRNEESLLKIDNYYNKEKVYTSKNLRVYLRWFERYATENNEVKFFNCTEGGAYIKGFKHITLKDYIRLYLKEKK